MAVTGLNDPSAPADTGGLAYLIFFWLGAGFLFPWNSFITGVDYFAILYPSAHIDYLFALAYMSTNLATLLLLMRFHGHYTSKTRIQVGFALFLLLILMVPVLDMVTIKGDKGTVGSLILTVSAVVASGAIDGVVQGSLFGMAGHLPERYTQALSGGTSASGVIISLARVVTKAALPDTLDGLRASARLYFIISAIFIAMCLVGTEALQNIPILQFYQSRKESHIQNLNNQSQTAALNPSPEPLSETTPVLERIFDSDFLTLEGHAMALNPVNEVDFFSTFWEVWELPCALAFVYFITLSIFPGFISEALESAYLGDWYPVLLFTAFNIADFFGKMAPTVVSAPPNAILVGGSLARLLLYPLFGLCVIGPAFFRSEIYVSVMTLGLGFSNGLCTSWLMMAAPSKVGLEKSEVVGFIMVLFLIIGLFLGSLSGWAWLLIL